MKQTKRKKWLSIALAACMILVVTGCSQEYEAGKEKQEVPVQEEESSASYTATIDVENYGTITVDLDADAAPKTVENFVTLANEGFYDGLTFHRIMKGFMIQGGDPTGTGMGGSEETIKGEFAINGVNNPIRHERGVISMARTQVPDSASSQFFICNADASSSLDGNYAAFGYVVEGLSVIDEITEDVFPKTAYADYYGSYEIDPYYQTYKHYVWQYMGNGAISDKDDQPVIKYIKVLDSWEK